jgi:hypothetical protein
MKRTGGPWGRKQDPTNRPRLLGTKTETVNGQRVLIKVYEGYGTREGPIEGQPPWVATASPNKNYRRALAPKSRKATQY